MMTKHIKDIRFALAKINTDQFAMIESAFKKDEKVNLKLTLLFGSNKDENLISVKTSFQFEQQIIPFLIIEATCFFKIEPNDWKCFEQGTEIIVPKNIITHFSALTVGTVRGILHTKTEGTNFNGFIIQPVNVTELVTEDIRM
jgi:hypothetical protein